MKTIFHLDLDSFFVSAERLRAPSLRGRPMAVGGEGPRAVISSASYEARKLGVRSAMPTAKALRLCPSLVVVPPDFSHYSALSRRVFDIVSRFTPVHEATGIDEGYLDMTGTSSLFGPPLEAAAKLRKAILDETGLTASIGIASNRLVAKIATDFCKPNNMHLVSAGSEATFLAPMPVGVLPGCGKVTMAWLHDRELKTIAQLQRYPVEVLEKHLGSFGRYLHDAAFGRGSTEFNEEAKTRSISRETTFEEDVDDGTRLRNLLWQMASELARELREEGVSARAVRLKLRYPPFHTVTRSRVLREPTQSDRVLGAAFCGLFEENWEQGSSLRLIGAGCVLGAEELQLKLFEQVSSDRKQDELERLRDSITRKFGDKALKTGRDL